MKRTSRLLALVLIVPMLASLHTALAMAAPANGTAHPAPCHGTRPTTPPPTRLDYQCCAAGHRWAIASAAFSAQLPLTASLSLLMLPEDALIPDNLNPKLVIPSDSPPLSSPLRI
jgi:hypothetical protein